MRRAILVALLLTAPLAAQDEPALPPVFDEAIDVLVVNIETVVTDKQGNRVHGLKRDDFRLLVDGREVPIAYFTEVRDGLERGSVVLDDLDAGAELPAEPIATNYLIFVDHFFAIGAQRDLVLDGLADQLGSLGPKDQVAVVSWDGHRARMLVDWTGDPATIRSGLAAAQDVRAGGAQRRTEARMFSTVQAPRIDGDNDGTQGAGVFGSAFVNSGSTLDAYFPILARQIERLVEASTASLRGSLPPPGRKVALLVAGGWASGPLLTTSDFARPGVAGREILDRQDEVLQAGIWYRPLVDAANLLGYTLYPIDAPGSGWTGPGVEAAGGGAGFSNPERNVEYTLKQLAFETGGRPLLNGLRSNAFEIVVEDTRSYYWLGFSAARQGTGRQHDIEIEVLDPGLEVRSRETFVDLSRREESVRTVEAGLILGDGGDMGDLDVEVGGYRRVKRKQVEVPLTVRIPYEDLEIVRLDNRLMAVFEVSLGARDKRDVVSDIFSVPVEVAIPQAPPPGAAITYEISATVRRERHEFVVTVRDVIGGDVFVRRLTFDPRAKGGASPAVADL